MIVLLHSLYYSKSAVNMVALYCKITKKDEATCLILKGYLLDSGFVSVGTALGFAPMTI
jgi:hypothetical protein